MMSVFDLDHHLATEHKVSPLSTYLKEIVYGGTDGIVTTFTVVAGFAGAHASDGIALPVLTVLLFGFANLSADGVAMALGSFLSTRSEQDVYRGEKKKELHEIRTNQRMERVESIAILQKRGFTHQQAETLVDIYATNEAYWLSFMMNHELEMPNPESDNSFFMALATFFSFVTFGIIPLLPYVFLEHRGNMFLLSSVGAFIALIILGILRWKISKQPWVRSVGETLLLGGVAAVVAYFVGTLFRL